NLGADPVYRERHEPDADFGVEAPHGLHQADVAFLNQVAELQPVTGVAPGDVDDEPEVRQDELAGRIEIVVVAEPNRELPLLVRLQDRQAVDRLDVVIQAADRPGKHEVVVSQSNSSGHLAPPESLDTSTRSLRVLTTGAVLGAGGGAAVPVPVLHLMVFPAGQPCRIGNGFW